MKKDLGMKQDFVEFLSPGTFVNEVTVRPIDSWDVHEAIEMARSIKERYNARPFGFRFFTRERGPEDLDSHVTEKSNIYYLGGKIETIEDVRKRNDPKERILLDNMEANGFDRIIINENSWRWTAPLEEGDVVLQVDLRN